MPQDRTSAKEISVRSHAIVVENGSFRLSASMWPKRLKKVDAAFPQPPGVLKTKGKKVPCSTSRTLSSYERRFSCSCLVYTDASDELEERLERTWGLNTRMS